MGCCGCAGRRATCAHCGLAPRAPSLCRSAKSASSRSGWGGPSAAPYAASVACGCSCRRRRFPRAEPDGTASTTSCSSPRRRVPERTERLAASWRPRALSLRFDDEQLERGFRRSFDAAALPLVRMGTGLGIALTVVFGVLDVWVGGDDLIAALVVHGVVAGLLVGC